MNTPAHIESHAPFTFPAAINTAAKIAAPAWPLDSAIAVNPWWPLREKPFSEVSAHLAALGRVQCLMPKAFYLSQWGESIQESHLVAAAHTESVSIEVSALVAFLDEKESPPLSWLNVCDMLDALPEKTGKVLWRDEIIHQISQYCGLYFQHPEQLGDGTNTTNDFYTTWLEVVRQDKGIEVLMAAPGLHEHFVALPETPQALCQHVADSFGTPEHFSEYAQALLLDIHGWASFLAYQRWQDNFQEVESTWVEQLLAIRLAWDWVLWSHYEHIDHDGFSLIKARFLKQFDHFPALAEQHVVQQKTLWVWQRALEISYQSQLQAKLTQTTFQPSTQIDPQNAAQAPALQAAFCIDVRSEPMRRALEAQNAGIETLGFAGFFGLPIEYTFTDSRYRRPQLPGLLMPTVQVTQTDFDSNASKRSSDLKLSNQLDAAFDAAPASLGLVEMLGALKSGSLLKNSLWPDKAKHPINALCDDRRFVLSRDKTRLTLDEKTEIVAGVLKAMSLTEGFANHVLLVGHTSCTSNNPQAASLDCGACGGQSGEVNVKVLAQLLNDEAIRDALTGVGITIPEHTRFVAAMHNTTTDDIICYGHLPEGEWQQWLTAATQLAQLTRARTLDWEKSGDELSTQYEQRSRDWSELRPEWGLANNAAFIVAPRSLTKGLDLQGRSFLHDYEWQQDEGFAVLELIMTAPMIVTNWINLQYFASVTDNKLYGSGNKLLHNVVGEHIGLFEGNGGDLRIGLSLQSLHDGQQWRHAPQRLSVYIEAPQSAIAEIVAAHEEVSQLVENEWLYLFQIDSQSNDISRYYQTGWHPSKQLA